eukprot:2961216-Pyramimonas_sp.AAC.1
MGLLELKEIYQHVQPVGHSRYNAVRGLLSAAAHALHIIDWCFTSSFTLRDDFGKTIRLTDPSPPLLSDQLQGG